MDKLTCMLVAIFKNYFDYVKEKRVKIFLTNIIFFVCYCFLFVMFGLFRFSEPIAMVLRNMHFLLVSFLTVPILVWLDGAIYFIEAVKATWKSSLLITIFTVAVNGSLIFLLRFFVAKNRPLLIGTSVFLLMMVALTFAYVPALLSKRNQSFFLSCKKSAVIFLQYPLITFVLVFVQVVFRLTALFSYFLFPTWILAEVLFLIFFKFYEKFTNKKYKK